MKVAVVGNCQARPVADFISAMCSEVERLPETIVHLSGPATAADDLERLDQADVLLAQSVHDGYLASHLTTNALRQRYGKRVVVWPNLFFNGNCADLAYLTSENNERLQSPLSAYHNRYIFECWKKGVAETSALEELEAIVTSCPDAIIENVELSLNELRQRDEHSDVQIVEHIATHWQSRRLFFTFNHPTGELLAELSRQLADAAGIRRVSLEATGDEKEPLDPIIPATDEHIADILDLSYPANNLSKGVEINVEQGKVTTTGSRQYSLPELIHQSYRAYDAQPAAKLAVRVTPTYSVS